MRIRTLVVTAILLAAGLTAAIRGGSPALALSAFMAILAAWALLAFLRWRESLRHLASFDRAELHPPLVQQDGRSAITRYRSTLGCQPRSSGKE